MPASGCRFIPLALPATGLFLVSPVAAAGNPHDAPISPATPLTQTHPREKTPRALALAEPLEGGIVEVRHPSHLLSARKTQLHHGATEYTEG